VLATGRSMEFVALYAAAFIVGGLALYALAQGVYRVDGADWLIVVGAWSVSAAIQNPVKVPVLADGLFVHATRPTGQLPPWETDVQLPNINCPKCTLQVVQFMAEHANNNPGGYSYHHCAELQIAADPTKPMDAGWPAAR